MDCPKCNQVDLPRDEVDVGVGVIYGPYGCSCGWSEWKQYDRSDGVSKEQLKSPDRYVDQWGGSQSIKSISDKLEKFGISREDVEEIFKVEDK